MSGRPTLLLVYPRLGFVGSFVRNVPLSLVYVATRARRLPIDIEILDLRLAEDWEAAVRARLEAGNVIAVGISVMSGIPILNALEVSRLVKRLSRAPVIWGGPHPTILPEEVMRRGEVDFVVRGFGADALASLLGKLLSGDRAWGGVPGLCYRENGATVIAPINCDYEFFDFREIPYDLLEPTLERYFEGMRERFFPVYSSVGCAYQCAFCIAPVWYRENARKWIPLDRDQVVDHIEWLKERYGITFVYFYDDDSFVDPRHFMGVAREIERRGIAMKFGFRGLRANEVVRLSDDDLSLLERIGVKTVHVGAESGSPRMLELMKKGITLEQTHRANRMLARHRGITPIYNLLTGLPGETLADLRRTRDLMLSLVEENPGAILVWPAKLIPYPGSELYELARAHGFRPPADIEGWSALDQELDLRVPWIPPENDRYIRMLQVTSYVIDNKMPYLENCGPLFKLLFRLFRLLYRPLALWRLRNDRCGLLAEYRLLALAKRVLQR